MTRDKKGRPVFTQIDIDKLYAAAHCERSRKITDMIARRHGLRVRRKLKRAA